jgi:polyisoprenyl-teichoic acid--peptidoglycan teichoic acid transferase
MSGTTGSTAKVNRSDAGKNIVEREPRGPARSDRLSEQVGYRTQRRQAQQRKKSNLWVWVVAGVAVLIIVFVVLGAVVKVSPIDKAWNNSLGWVGHQIKAAWPFKGTKKVAAADFLPKGKKTADYLVAVTKQAGGETYLSTVVLASYDSKTKTGSLVFFPNDLLVAAPGMGSDLLSNLVQLDGGRVDSTKVTVENMLGTKVDRYILASDRDLRIILSQLGDKFTVVVPSKLSYKDPSLNVNMDLKPGKQTLDATRMASYLTYGAEGKSLDLAKRQAEIAPALISMMAATNTKEFVKKNANLFDTNATNAELEGVLKAFDALKGGLSTIVLPVKEFKYEKTVVNRADQAAIPAFVKKYVKSVNPDAPKRLRVEILNGCGVPGIGEKVASSIDLSKYQVVNSGNAESFDHPETQIIVYSNSKSSLAAANELRNGLEVGTVVTQPQSQDLTDMTIIVGKDYASK